MNYPKKLILHNFCFSSSSWRVRNILAYKGINYEYKAVDLFKQQNLSPEF